MSLFIVADGSEYDPNGLATLLSSSTPEKIRASKGNKHKEFTLRNDGNYDMSTPQIGPGLMRHNAMIVVAPEKVVAKIKSEFSVAGGRRSRRRSRRSRKTRKYRR